MQLEEISQLVSGEQKKMLFLAELVPLTVAPQVLQDTTTLSGILNAFS